MMSPRRVSFTPARSTRSARCAQRRTRRGFSFTEVLFAVMILGVGFIMVAAIFPVAIQQARTTSEEGSAAAIARGAVSFIEQNLTNADMPAIRTAGSRPGSPLPVQSFRDPQAARGSSRIPILNQQPAPWVRDQLWNKVRGNLINAEDPRYAWVPLYRRDLVPSGVGPTEVPSPYAQVFIIVTQVRNDTAYSAGKDTHTTNSGPTAMVNLQARPVSVNISGAAQRITFNVTPERNHLAAAEGCYVIISDDNLTGDNAGRMNGRIYRVGNRFGTSDTEWELMPGNDFVAEPARTLPSGTTLSAITGLTGASAFIVGRTLVPGARGAAVFQGTAQDIAIYTTFIQVR